MPDRSSAIPPTPLALGIAGLAPFVGFAALIGFGVPTLSTGGLAVPAMAALLAYGAVILSFMGGVHWGLALRGAPPTGYVASVLPSLTGWFAVLLLPPAPAALALAAAFAALLLYDLAVIGRSEAPPWYGRLRIGLTGIVVATLLVASLKHAG